MKRQIVIFSMMFLTLTTYGQTITNQTKDSLRNVICKMLADDQQVRSGDMDLKNRKEIDSINFDQLKAITNKFGFPDLMRMGGNDCSAHPFLILLHNADRLIEKENYELFMGEFRKGNISGWELGQALDRYYVHFYKKSLYGLYGRDKPCIGDMETVNRNRKELGLKELERGGFTNCR